MGILIYPTIVGEGGRIGRVLIKLNLKNRRISPSWWAQPGSLYPNMWGLPGFHPPYMGVKTPQTSFDF